MKNRHKGLGKRNILADDDAIEHIARMAAGDLRSAYNALELAVLTTPPNADGKIIVCETVSQKETDGIGSACADASFYSQFNGKTAENYGEIDAISGATITTQGYKTAVSKIFEAIKILKGDE